MASLSITKPGLTPVPTSATPQVFASSSSCLESSGYLRKGYDNSSQVETMQDSAARHSINCSITDGSDEEVEWMTISADLPSMVAASATTGTPQGASGAPTTSPRSRPAFAGSLSIAPITSTALFSRSRRTMAAPMGPTPY